MSLAAGRDMIPKPSLMAGNVDMNATLKSSHWPDRGGDIWLRKNWLHSDIRNMAYIFTYKVFDELVSQQGGLE
jgi:hypothetical protein